MILRIATENDIARIAELEKICFPTEPWSAEMVRKDIVENNQAAYVVADVSDQDPRKGVIGYIGIWQILDEGHITNVAVDPEYRRGHIGETLLLWMLNITVKAGVRAWTLEVRESNIPAINLYTKHGFLAEGVRRGYYQDNHEDAIVMWRRI